MEAAGAGRCRGAFWMALLFDAAGLSLLLLGSFVDVFFADLLIYSGGVGLLFSLLWWVFWYVGNIEVPPDELQDDIGLGEEAMPAAMEAEATGRAWRVRFMVRSLGRHLSGSFHSKPVHSDKKTEADSAVGETVTGSPPSQKRLRF
ncbi:transmembrane protein 238-like [Anolis sagrei]|uniref:transmembrane protein 238-like n=1 Tax=Anolis sagrei TaxID=38937 RepID=UPI00295BD105|nr:transmembrane protein 238-like [Anolis sagrei ordinatus]